MKENATMQDIVNFYDTSDIKIDVANIAAICNPFETNIWPCNPVTVEMVEECIVSKKFNKEVYTRVRDVYRDWTAEEHAERIAFYVVNGWENETIHIDVGCPSFGFCPDWIVLDGNHRLAAAIFREDKQIRCDISGECKTIDELVTGKFKKDL